MDILNGQWLRVKILKISKKSSEKKYKAHKFYLMERLSSHKIFRAIRVVG